MQRPRILHIFSRYGEVGGEEICFHAITEALGAIADVTPFVYSTEELFHSPHGALTKMGYLLHNRDVEQKLRKCLRENRYDAWIIHNTFPAMSSCVYELALHPLHAQLPLRLPQRSILPGRSALLFLPRRQLFSRHHARLLEEKRRILLPGRRRPV